MRDEVTVSIIIPVYNSEQYVADCLDSVLNEHISNMEILVMDDASTDRSEEICRKYAEEHAEITYCRLEHGGVSAARNAGLDRAIGKYVFFIDSDDRVEQGLLRSLLDKTEAHGAVMGNSILREFGAGSAAHFSLQKELAEVLEGEELMKQFLSGYKSMMAMGGKLMLRSTIGEQRFRTDLTSGEDTYFIYEFLQKGGKTVFEFDTYYEYRMHRNNTIHVPKVVNLQSTFTVCRSLYEEEVQRVGLEKSMNIGYHQPNIIRIWMKRCVKYKNTGELRKNVIQCIKIIKASPLYAKLGRRYKLHTFVFRYLWPLYKLVYGRKECDLPTCSGCGACADICPFGAIEMHTERDGFSYPKKNAAKCTECGLCDRVCAHKWDYDVKKDNTFYALQAKPSIREVSTSGGAFRLLAENVLAEGGAVVGASMNRLKVGHVVIEDIQQLPRLQGSKYVQSETTGIYKTVEQLLLENRKVLFSGTPCQVDALQRFLGKDYHNLYLVDLICNGVASPRIWKRYTRYLEKKYKSKLLDYSFRDKREHDDGHTIAAVFADGERTWSMYDDKFCTSYFRGFSLRKQCASCLYCTEQRNSDLTIGDYWGVEKKYPEMNDGMGTSLVIVHSEKGRKLFEEIAREAKVVELTKTDARQPRLCYPADMAINANIAQRVSGIMPIRLWFRIFVK